MALLFMDGFDQYNDEADLEDSSRWGTNYHATYWYLVEGRGGAGTQAFNNRGNYLTYPSVIVTNSKEDTLILHVAVFHDATVTTTGLIAFRDNKGNNLIYAEQLTPGEYTFKNGDGGVLGTCTTASSSWFHLQIKVKFHATAGTLQVKVNDIEELNLTGLDTVDNGTVDNWCTAIAIGSNSNSSGNLSYFDDVVLIDTLGTTNNDFLGDVTVDVLWPDADSSVAWTKSTGANNYENVDTYDTAGTNYNYSTTAGQTDLFTFEDLAVSPDSIHAVAMNAMVKKDVSGSRKLKLHANTGANSNESGQLDSANAATFTDHQAFWEYQTGTTDWTESAVNALIGGYELDA